VAHGSIKDFLKEMPISFLEAPDGPCQELVDEVAGALGFYQKLQSRAPDINTVL
jgi:hypothetical protein